MPSDRDEVRYPEGPGEEPVENRDLTSAVIDLYRREVDVSLLRSRLRLSIDERFRELMKTQRSVEAMRRAGRESRGVGR